jgi:hypothetical protein
MAKPRSFHPAHARLYSTFGYSLAGGSPLSVGGVEDLTSPEGSNMGYTGVEPLNNGEFSVILCYYLSKTKGRV